MANTISSGLPAGDYVPLTVDEFRRGFGKYIAYISGQEPLPDNFEATIMVAHTGQPVKPKVTEYNKAWLTVGSGFPDESKRISFYVRMQLILSVIGDPKYAKHYDQRTGLMHVGLAAAIAQVQFSSRTTPKALKAAFDAEFRRQYDAAEAAYDASEKIRH